MPRRLTLALALLGIAGAAGPAAAQLGTCPPAGTRVLTSHGMILEAFGSEPGQPLRCRAGWYGEGASGMGTTVLHVARMMVRG